MTLRALCPPPSPPSRSLTIKKALFFDFKTESRLLLLEPNKGPGADPWPGKENQVEELVAKLSRAAEADIEVIRAFDARTDGRAC